MSETIGRPEAPSHLEHPGFEALALEARPAIQVGPGCTRRDLPSTGNVRVWLVEIAAGHQWPHVDFHAHGEEVLVLDGELIEGTRRFGPGTYVHFSPGSSHQPRTERGVRLFGLNLVPGAVK